MLPCLLFRNNTVDVEFISAEFSAVQQLLHRRVCFLEKVKQATEVGGCGAEFIHHFHHRPPTYLSALSAHDIALVC